MTRRRLVVEADGGSRGNPGPAGYGALVRDPVTGAVLAERGGYLGVATNNVAEYRGLLAGLAAARDLDPDADVEVRMDSRLVVEQMSGRWQVKHEDMRRLVAEARALLAADRVRFTWVPRAENGAADRLANEAMDTRADIVRDVAGDTGDPAPATDTAEAPAAEDGRAGTPGPPQGLRARRPSGSAMRFDDVEPVTVVLVRHGETALTRSRALSGSSEPGPSLTATGRVQAARAADVVHRVGRSLWPDLPYPGAVRASPMLRTQETGAAVGRRIGAAVETDPAFAEVDFGSWQGLTPDEVEDGWPGELRRWYEDSSVRAPGGESMTDVGGRVRDGLGALLGSGTARTVVVVSHVMAIRSAVGVTLGMPPHAWGAVRVPAASVSVVRWWPDGAREVVVVGMPTDVRSTP